MRSFLVGLIFLFCANAAFGQATGFVVKIGIEGIYRPDCWTSMLVHLDSTLSDAAEYQIQVHQQDMDRDTVVYAHTVTLGPQAHQDYWVYFLPQPTGRLADGGSLPSRQQEVAEVLQVHLYDKRGKTEIARLPAQVPASNLDPASQGMARQRGMKLILCVVDSDLPSWSEYTRARGTAEDVAFLPIKARDLPEGVLAYQAVDGIIWFDANAMEISTGGSKVFDAIQEYIRQGGTLVVCQPALQFVRVAPFANAGMLPVVAKDEKGEWALQTKGKADLAPLIGLAASPDSRVGEPAGWSKLEKSKSQWDFVRARATPDAKVDSWIQWDPKNPDADKSPYIARKAYGMGSVTWVAQDLGDPSLTKMPGIGGWPHVWDSVFAWKNKTYTEAELARMSQKDHENTLGQYGDGGAADLGGSLRPGLEHAATAATYIFIAVVFFIGYWIIAGPGSYLLLASRGKKGLSWTAFGVVALAAAGLTVIVVKLVLRGSPVAHHVSIVKLSPATPDAEGKPRFNAFVRSNFGLYIPRDGEQAITVSDVTPGQGTYVSPYAIHPAQLKEDTGFTDRAKYVVSTDEPVIAADKTHVEPIEVDVPYRSTLKKLQAQWSGTVSEGISGSAKLVPKGPKRPDPDNTKNLIDTGTITGKLTNSTGRDLQGVYIAFNPYLNSDPSTPLDWLLYIDSWRKDSVLDLESEFNRAEMLSTNSDNWPQSDMRGAKRIKGLLSGPFWGRFWYSKLAPSLVQTDVVPDDHEQNFARSLPLMAFFSRLEPQAGEKDNSYQRVDLLRRGGRDLDVSSLVACGRLVIVARAEASAPPLPLAVEGDKAEGAGVIFYETSLPLDHSAMEQPATQPAAKKR